MTKTQTFRSEIAIVDRVSLPTFSGIRVMMMPFLVHDPRGSLPRDLDGYLPVLAMACQHAGRRGTGYVTIDEAHVSAGQTHRRPGLHVDGVGGWGAQGSWGAQGWYTTSSHYGCDAWAQSFDGVPGSDGGCEHLRAQCRVTALVPLRPGVLYELNPLAVHVARPMSSATRRQFLRVSMPSSAPWFDGYTRNPRGIEPGGPVMPRRTAEMDYRA